MAKFQPGQSGNPKGRKKGVPTKAHIFLNHLMPNAETLMHKALEIASSAGEGNSEGTAILKLLIDRILPKSNDNLLAIGLLAGTLTQKSNKVFDMMSDGKMMVSDGTELMKALSQVQNTNMQEVNARLDILDKAQENITLVMRENQHLRAKIEQLEKEKDGG